MSDLYSPGEALDIHRSGQREESGFQRVGNEIVCRRSLIQPPVSRFEKKDRILVQRIFSGVFRGVGIAAGAH
jgi:hypothetical protein